MVLFRFPPGLTQFVEFRLQRVIAPPKRVVGGAFPAQFVVFGLLPRDELGQFVGVFVLLLVGVVVGGGGVVAEIDGGGGESLLVLFSARMRYFFVG